MREGKSAAMQLATNKMAILVEEVLDDILRKTFCNMQSDSWLVVYNVAEQWMLDFLLEDVIEQTLHAHIC